MKNLKTVTDSELITQIRRDAAQERSSGLAVIHQLREIARRRLDAKLGYSSLFKYCTEDLKYSPGSAWRRIRTMEALRDLPELESKIAEGDLTLANVSQVQSFCVQKGKTTEEKKDILEQVTGLSKRETEKKLAALAPLPPKPDQTRELDGKKTELRVTLDQATIAALDKIRDLIAHAHPGASYAEVITLLAQLGLKKWDPAAEKGRRKALPAQAEKVSDTANEKAPETANAEKAADIENTKNTNKKTSQVEKASKKVSFPPAERIPAATRREVWRRDKGVCQYVSPETGKKCQARALVQPDHLVPRARGGGHEASNLQLKCRSHNLLAAIQVFGEIKMRPYLRKRC